MTLNWACLIIGALCWIAGFFMGTSTAMPIVKNKEEELS